MSPAEDLCAAVLGVVTPPPGILTPDDGVASLDGGGGGVFELSIVAVPEERLRSKAGVFFDAGVLLSMIWLGLLLLCKIKRMEQENSANLLDT